MVGVCHLCSQEKELTFEHVPPQATGNNSPIKVIELHEKLNNGKRYSQKQRGMGEKRLCSECNSFLGMKFVNEYTEFVKGIKSVDAIFLKSVKIEISPLKVIKQLLSMFITLNYIGYTEREKIAHFILNDEAMPSELDIRVYCYSQSENSRYNKFIPFTVIKNIKGIKKETDIKKIEDITICEISMEGIGIIICLENELDTRIIKKNNIVEITDFLYFELEQKIMWEKFVGVVETNSFYPLDFRKTNNKKEKFEFKKELNGLEVYTNDSLPEGYLYLFGNRREVQIFIQERK